MDYNFDDSGINKSFERKTLTHQQWELMVKTGLEKGYLKP